MNNTFPCSTLLGVAVKGFVHALASSICSGGTRGLSTRSSAPKAEVLHQTTTIVTPALTITFFTDTPRTSAI